MWTRLLCAALVAATMLSGQVAQAEEAVVTPEVWGAVGDEYPIARWFWTIANNSVDQCEVPVTVAQIRGQEVCDLLTERGGYAISEGTPKPQPRVVVGCTNRTTITVQCKKGPKGPEPVMYTNFTIDHNGNVVTVDQ